MNRQLLIHYVDKGLSTYQIADQLSVSQTKVRYWLSKYNLKTSKKKKSDFDKDGLRQCDSCNQLLPLDNYYRRTKGDYHNVCKSCFNKSTVERQRRLKKQAVDYKGGRCESCGYDKCIAALEFHHVDPTQKDFTISRHKNKSLNQEMKFELDKCILLCANCHAEEHYKGD